MNFVAAIKKILANDKIASIFAAACFSVYANAPYNQFVWDGGERAKQQ